MCKPPGPAFRLTHIQTYRQVTQFKRLAWFGIYKDIKLVFIDLFICLYWRGFTIFIEM